MRPIFMRDVVKLLGLCEHTIRLLEQKGKLKAYRDYRNYRVFDLDEVLSIKKDRESIRGGPGAVGQQQSTREILHVSYRNPIQP